MSKNIVLMGLHRRVWNKTVSQLIINSVKIYIYIYSCNCSPGADKNVSSTCISTKFNDSTLEKGKKEDLVSTRKEKERERERESRH